MSEATVMVSAFHKLNGNVSNCKNNGPDVAALRIGLIVEEFAETLAAMRAGDVVEVADGLADLLYVIAGTAESYGAQARCVFREPDRPLATAFEPFEIVMFARLVLPRVTRLAHAVGVAQIDIATSVDDLWDVIVESATHAWGLPIERLFTEVHRSNMTKTFAPALNRPGGKYAAGVNPKGPGYEPPNIHAVLGLTGIAE